MALLDSTGFVMRTAMRRLAARKPNAAAIVLTLGIGLAAVVFMSALGYGVLLRPLPYPNPSRLAEITTTDAAGRPGGVSLPDVDDWRRQALSFDAMSAFIQLDGSLETASGTQSIRLAAVDRAFFDVLAMPPVRGRLLSAQDDRAPVIVLSVNAWRRFFGPDDVAGATVKVNGASATVLGVANPAIAIPGADVDGWIPLEHARLAGPPQWAMRGFRGFRAIGRVRADATPERAADELLAISARLASEYPRFNDGVRTSVTPLSRKLALPVRQVLLYLWLGAVLLLLITCANAASLGLADSVARRQELAVRVALGAGPSRLALETVTELMLLSFAGAGVGVAVAAGLLRWFQDHHPERFPRLDAIRIDPVVVSVAVIAAVVSALLAAAAPALRSMRANSADALKDARSGGRVSSRAHRLLLLGQVTMTVVLLLGTLSIARQLSRLLQADLGVADTNVVTARLDLAGAEYGRPDAQRRFVRQLLERLTADGAMAGVLSSLPPETGQMRTTIKAAGAETASPDVLVDIVASSPAALETLGVPLLQGRRITDADTTDGAPVALLSVTAARRLFPGREPLGLRIPFGSTPAMQPTVIGIVGDVRYRGLDAAADAAMYVPASQRLFRTVYVVARGSDKPEVVGRRLSGEVRRIDPSVAVGTVRTLAALRLDAAAGYSFRTTIIGTLTIAALFLTGVGIHGVTAQSMAHRRREFAVRTALGGQRRQLLALVLRETVWLCGGGAMVGVLLTEIGRRTAGSVLAGFADVDGTAISISCALAIVLGIGAALGPVWRAATRDAAPALR